MKTRKILSLALALALCLGLAASALAADFPYAVDFTPDFEAVPNGTVLSLRNWDYSEQHDPSTNAYEGYRYTLGEVTQWPLDPSYSYRLPLDGEITIKMADHSTFDSTSIYLQAWSDPDGDGVYTQRLAVNEFVNTDNGAEVSDRLLPVDMGSPIQEFELMAALENEGKGLYSITNSWNFKDSGKVDMCCEAWYELDELKLSASYLAQLFGKNTFLYMAFPTDDGEYCFNFLITDVPEQTPAKPEETAAVAYPSTQTVDVDGKTVEFQCYALKDAAGNDTNYIKLRDLADILNGSAAQFEVGWDGQVTVTTGQGYTKNGSEQNTPFSGNRAYKEVTAQTMVDGKAADLAAFTLTDDNGGGYTYYKLRDLGTALGFKVDWTAERGIFIKTK